MMIFNFVQDSIRLIIGLITFLNPVFLIYLEMISSSSKMKVYSTRLSPAMHSNLLQLYSFIIYENNLV